MKIREILELEDSSIIRLSRSTGEGVDIRADNQTLAVRRNYRDRRSRRSPHQRNSSKKKINETRIFLTIYNLYSGSVRILFASSAQEAADQTAAADARQNAEIMGENDRLPFMQNEQMRQVHEPTSGGLLLKTLGAMFLIIGLIFVGAWGAKKYGLFGIKSKNYRRRPNLKIMSSVSVATDKQFRPFDSAKEFYSSVRPRNLLRC